jgi:hypothetical protein
MSKLLLVCVAVALLCVVGARADWECSLCSEVATPIAEQLINFIENSPYGVQDLEQAVKQWIVTNVCDELPSFLSPDCSSLDGYVVNLVNKYVDGELSSISGAELCGAVHLC